MSIMSDEMLLRWILLTREVKIFKWVIQGDVSLSRLRWIAKQCHKNYFIRYPDKASYFVKNEREARIMKDYPCIVSSGYMKSFLSRQGMARLNHNPKTSFQNSFIYKNDVSHLRVLSGSDVVIRYETKRKNIRVVENKIGGLIGGIHFL